MGILATYTEAKEAKKAKAKSLASSEEQRRNAALKQTSSSNAKELKSVMTTAKTTAFAPCAASSAGPSAAPAFVAIKAVVLLSILA